LLGHRPENRFGSHPQSARSAGNPHPPIRGHELMASRFLERLLQSAGFQDCLKSEVRRHTRRHIPLKCLKTWLTGAVNLPFASSQRAP
jgi:hypothetical protein